MRKLIFLCIFAIISISFIGCGQTKEEIESKEEIEQKQGTLDFEQVDLNSTINSEFADLTFTTTKVTRAASEKETGIDLETKEDSIWFIILGTIKNLDVSEIDFKNGLNAQLVLDDKYTYPVIIAPNTLNSIVPLQTTEFAIYSSVPDEVIELCNLYSFEFGFNERFELGDSIEDSIYKYKITGNLDEYGSAENIENYQTFKEYIATFLSATKYEELQAKSEEKSNIIIIQNSNCLAYTKPNDEFYIFPHLDLLYNIYEMGEKYSNSETYCYGVLKIEFNGASHPDNVYYTGAETITLSSDTGVITIGEGLERTYDYNKLTHNSYVTFNFNSEDVSFDELLNIISGNNLTMVFDVEVSGSDSIKITYECSEEMQSTLITLIEIYKQLPKASWK